jgi:renal tumor antigen
MYEILTARPLFPGKHELDQITRIHNVLGTPAREVLSQFHQNPNRQITFSFPQRAAQSWATLLPFVSRDTIDLISQLLMYNPIDRITAEDALMHPAFEDIRAAERRWAELGQRGAFPVFYLSGDLEIGAEVPSLIPEFKMHVTYVKPLGMADVEKPAVSQAPPAPTVESKKVLAESRRLAIERIMKYNAAHVANRGKDVKQHPTLGIGAARIVKHTVLNPPPGIVGQGFLKPRIGICHPRVSSFVPKIH